MDDVGHSSAPFSCPFLSSLFLLLSPTHSGPQLRKWQAHSFHFPFGLHSKCHFESSATHRCAYIMMHCVRFLYSCRCSRASARPHSFPKWRLHLCIALPRVLQSPPLVACLPPHLKVRAPCAQTGRRAVLHHMRAHSWLRLSSVAPPVQAAAVPALHGGQKLHRIDQVGNYASAKNILVSFSRVS